MAVFSFVLLSYISGECLRSRASAPKSGRSDYEVKVRLVLERRANAIAYGGTILLEVMGMLCSPTSNM